MNASNQSPSPSALSRALVAQETQELRRNLQTPIPAPRIDLERKINLRFPHFQGFLTEYSSNISITGMFVRSGDPQAPGTILDFEFNLIDGLKLIQGTGEVVWVRLVDEGPDLPTGMGIRFLRLDSESRRLIRWAVEKQIDQGTELFQLQKRPAEDRIPEQVRPPAPSAAQRSGAAEDTAPPVDQPRDRIDTGRLYPFAGAASARNASWPRRLMTAGAGTLAAGLVALAGYASLAPHLRAPTETPPLPTLAVTPATPGPESRPVAAPAVPSAEEQLVAATGAWARAWAEQRPDDYLALYSPRFSPPGEASRGQWEAQRRTRIRRPSFIQVAIGGLEVELLARDRGRVTFDQVYSSDSFRDEMRKTLELVHEDGRWLIAGERAAD